MKVVADFWEDHCVECGEPDCFKSCPKFHWGSHGRCERVLSGDDGRIEFCQWGKLELLWHGRMASRETADRLQLWNARWEPIARFAQRMFGWLPVPYGKGPYGVFRSFRWRKAMRESEYAEAPDKWELEISVERLLSLILEVKDASNNILFSRTIEVEKDAVAFDFVLPSVKAGALFSIRPADADATCCVTILKNALVKDVAKTIKCVAWDLDNTIWKGILSEGDDVRLKEGVLDVIKELDRRGVVNSIVSKNDEDVAIAKLESFGVEEWFVFPQINWGPKSESLKNLATEMNIGLDAIAFVDDREENRREVMSELPQVRVFAETDIPALVKRLETDGLIPAIATGSLGGERRKMYREEMGRRKAAKSFDGDTQSFNEASGLEFELLEVSGERKIRCLELVQRTNQLNLTARRYDEGRFDKLLASTECRAVRVWDKYGDYGIVGFLAWRGMHLVECCFSCRVAKRGVEAEVLKSISFGKGWTADVVATDRNKPIRDIVQGWMNND